MSPDLSRRVFLSTTASALGAAALAQAQTAAPPAAPGTPAPPEKPEPTQEPKPPAARKLGLAIVGLGKLAMEEILPAFAKTERCRVAALVTGHPDDKGRTVAQRYGVKPAAIYTYDTYDQMRDNPDIDAVYIVLPNSMHAEFTVRAANAGKHVLCEKPMATAAADCRQMIDACARAGKKLMIAYRIQYEPHNTKARDLLHSGQFGKARVITSVNTQNQEANTWRTVKKLAGGGSLPDIGLYCLNTTRFLLGEEPVEVQAYTFSPPNDPRFKEVEDVMQFTLRFPSGAVLNALSSYSAANKKGYDIIAEKGIITADPAFPYRGLKLKSQQGEKGGKTVTEYDLPDANQFALEMDHFAQAVLDNKPVKTPGEEGLRDQLLMEAIYRSAETG
jgi:predicted dehydrogenase